MHRSAIQVQEPHRADSLPALDVQGGPPNPTPSVTPRTQASVADASRSGVVGGLGHRQRKDGGQREHPRPKDRAQARESAVANPTRRLVDQASDDSSSRRYETAAPGTDRTSSSDGRGASPQYMPIADALADAASYRLALALQTRGYEDLSRCEVWLAGWQGGRSVDMETPDLAAACARIAAHAAFRAVPALRGE